VLGAIMKKRKADSIVPEDTASYGSFCRAANAIAQLYTSGLNQQKQSYVAGQRSSLEKMLSFILREHGTSSEVSTSDIASYIRRELQGLNLEHGGGARGGIGVGAGSVNSNVNTQGGSIRGDGNGSLDSRVIAHNTGRLLRGERGAFFAGALSSPARKALPHVARLADGRRRIPTNTPPQFHERGALETIHALDSSPVGISRLKLNHNNITLQNQEREEDHIQQLDIEQIQDEEDDEIEETV